MNKEVIIDSIDVSGCKHYWNTKGLELCKINFDNNYYSNGLPLAEKCSFKDCYYKRMKRLEAENAELKEENFKLDFKLGQIDIKKITLVENRQLAEENEKLKEALEKTRKLNSSCADCDCYNACGACSNAEEKPYRSFKIADEVLKDE